MKNKFRGKSLQKNQLSIFQKYFIFSVVIMLLSVGQFTTDIYLPSVPSLINFFSTTEKSIQLTITLYYIGYGVSQLFYGPISDYYGRRPVILTSLSIYLIGTLLCLAAHNVETLLIGRIMQGAGIGGAGTIAAAIPHDIFSGKKVTQAYSYIGIAMAIAPLIAPVLGGYLQVLFGWKANFIFLLGYAFIFFVIVIFFFPETNLFVREANLSAIKLTKNYINFLYNKVYMTSLCCLILALLGEMLYIIWIPIILQIHLKISPIGNGWLMIFPAISLAAGSIFSSYLHNFFEKEVVVLFACLIIFLSVIALNLIFHYMGYSIPLLFISLSLYMIGSGIIFPLCIAICTGCFPKITGMAGSLMSAMLALGAGLWGTYLIELNAMSYNTLPQLLLMSSSLLLATGFLLFYQQWYSITKISKVVTQKSR